MTRLADLTWTEAADRAPWPAAILPLGATEAHGPHLPLGTDVVIAEEAARRAADALAGEGIATLVLPALPYGVTYAAAPFPGTLGLSVGALAAVLRDVARGLPQLGARCLVLATAHLEPVHVETLQTAARELVLATELRVLVADPRASEWAEGLTDEFRRGARHGGSYEASLLLAARPELVREAEMRELPSIWVDLPRAIASGARTFAEAGGAQAYFGDPARASAAEGEDSYAALARMLAALVRRGLQPLPEA